MKRLHWILAGAAGLLLSCGNAASDEEVKASDEATQPPEELLTQEAADREAEASITQENADEEFDRLLQEIESDQ